MDENEDILEVVNHDEEFARHLTEDQERDAIRDLEQRLQREFSAIPAETVDEVVETHYQQLADKPIRSYVPVLVEHAAKSDLIAIGGHPHGGANPPAGEPRAT